MTDKGSETGLKLPLTAHHLRLYVSSGIVTTIHCFGIAGEICRLCDLVPLLDHFETPSRSLSQTPNSVLAPLIHSRLIFLMPVFLRNHAHKKKRPKPYND